MMLVAVMLRANNQLIDAARTYSKLTHILRQNEDEYFNEILMSVFL